eukprot:5991354-Prymnesium_polylepis.1
MSVPVVSLIGAATSVSPGSASIGVVVDDVEALQHCLKKSKDSSSLSYSRSVCTHAPEVAFLAD